LHQQKGKMMSTTLSVSDRIDRARRMESAVQLATHQDPAQRRSAYEAARQFRVSQSAISQNRAYRAWKDNQNQGSSNNEKN
jgi:hypothetical protein